MKNRRFYTFWTGWAIIVIACLFLWGCFAPQTLTDEEQGYVDDAITTAEDMFDWRQSQDMYESDHENLKKLYILYSLRNDTIETGMDAYSKDTINEFQQKLGGVDSYKLLKSTLKNRELSSELRMQGYYVLLEYEVTGSNDTVKETIGLWKIHPDEDEKLGGRISALNDNAFRIIYHSQS